MSNVFKLVPSSTPTLHPDLAKEISRFVTRRSVAADMINTVLQRDDFKNDDFEFWKTEHVEATGKLAALGLTLLTYTDVGGSDA